MNVRIDKLLERIITVNHAWKLSREEFGQSFCATKSFRWTKSSLQATLLREFPRETSLKVASDNDSHDGLMYSVRLVDPIVVNGVVRRDAEHLPGFIAEQIFTPEEITLLLAR
ncbi:hypothetical protein [Vibrio genomosp. F10]|uniref:hypothetical protein n=1 Tax=Vibrio genomosp. F10 TaxID=723171 RepID=UPI00030E2B2F|nr:hypothetical protein [Vibrio genomosp. F10]OEE84646.1 hypothetical protein A1QK_03970 [Vibrio genomosp. F10 str. 9ZD137]OEF04610.1 hypothetical protein A1QI_11125 [Vibrio genomosp. F10 str. 9ZB36]